MSRSALFPLFACLLLLSACSDTVRSPDLPPAQLAAIGALNCEPTTLGEGQGGQCTFDAMGCQFLVVRSDGNQEFVTQACPEGVELTSSNPDIVSVDNSGAFTGNSPGVANIVATLNGVSSEPETITVGPACVEALEITPLAARISAGRDQPYRAFLKRTNGTRSEVTNNSVFTSGTPAIATFNGNVLESDENLATETTLDVSVNNQTSTGLCAGVTAPLVATTTVTLSPGQLIADGLCIDATPPAAAFEDAVCRPDTGACATSTLQLNLLPAPETLNLQVRGRFDNGLECDLTDDDATTLVIDPENVATLDPAAPSVTAEMSGTATLTATATVRAITQSEDRDVRVGDGQNIAFGASSLAVSSKELVGGAPYSFTNAQRFGCVGATDLVEGLSGRELAGQLNVFAKARSCDAADLREINGRMVCTAPSSAPADFGQPSIDAFNDLQRIEDYTNPMPEGANPFDDATTWSAVEGFWNGESCETGSGNSPAQVGDRFFPSRALDPDRGLDPTTQPNGVVYADGTVRLGFACVTATVTNPSNPAQTVTDGMTVLVLPLINDAVVTDPSLDADADRLCDTLLPIFDNPLLGVLQGTPLDALGRIELIEVLSTVTELVNPLLEATDVIPLGLVLETLINGGDFFPVGLADLTALILNPLNDGLIDPVVEPLLCTVTSTVNTLLGLLTGSSPNQECLDGSIPDDIPLIPSVLENLLNRLGLGGQP